MADSAIATAQQALLGIHEHVSGENAGGDAELYESLGTAPLDALLESLGEAVLSPDQTAPPHAGLRQALASLLYSSVQPPSLAAWLQATDTSDVKEVTQGRKKVLACCCFSCISILAFRL